MDSPPPLHFLLFSKKKKVDRRGELKDAILVLHDNEVNGLFCGFTVGMAIVKNHRSGHLLHRRGTTVNPTPPFYLRLISILFIFKKKVCFFVDKRCDISEERLVWWVGCFFLKKSLFFLFYFF